MSVQGRLTNKQARDKEGKVCMQFACDLHRPLATWSYGVVASRSGSQVLPSLDLSPSSVLLRGYPRLPKLLPPFSFSACSSRGKAAMPVQSDNLPLPESLESHGEPESALFAPAFSLPCLSLASRAPASPLLLRTSCHFSPSWRTSRFFIRHRSLLVVHSLFS